MPLHLFATAPHSAAAKSLILLGVGYGVRCFVSFCRHHPPVPKRDPHFLKALLNEQMNRHCRITYDTTTGVWGLTTPDGRTWSTTSKAELENRLDREEVPRCS